MAEMTAEQAAEWGKTLDFPTVWAALLNLGEKFDKRDGALTKKVDEAAKNADKEIAETRRALKDLMKTVNKVSENVGGLNRSMGELIETLIAARLWEQFPQYGLKRAYQRIPLYNENNEQKTDIDILLINTTMCLAVEVKRELNDIDEVKRHLRRMQLIRQYPPGLISPDLQLLGAMAGGRVDPDVKHFAYESGFFVLELSGESVRLIQPPEGFEPKKW